MCARDRYVCAVGVDDAGRVRGGASRPDACPAVRVAAVSTVSAPFHKVSRRVGRVADDVGSPTDAEGDDQVDQGVYAPATVTPTPAPRALGGLGEPLYALPVAHGRLLHSARPRRRRRRRRRARRGARTPRPRSAPCRRTCSSRRTGGRGSRLRTPMLGSVSPLVRCGHHEHVVDASDR